MCLALPICIIMHVRRGPSPSRGSGRCGTAGPHRAEGVEKNNTTYTYT